MGKSKYHDKIDRKYFQVPEIYIPYLDDWYYDMYFLFGGYGSGKSYNGAALKIILKLLKEKRKCLVVRETYASIRESCWDLMNEILSKLDLLAEGETKEAKINKVVAKVSPLSFEFPNGSRIIFKGLDKPGRIKSINDVSIIWIEECSEIKYSSFLELLGRVRTPDVSMHIILTTNPVGKDNWTYKHFFINEYEDGEGNLKEDIIMDDEKLYRSKVAVDNKKSVYYMHTTADDNPFLPASYIKRLDEIKNYDPDLYRVARLGQYGLNGLRVLPQLEVASDPAKFKAAVRNIPLSFRKIGMDFGFEKSFNAVVKMAIDDYNKYLYIYDEYYKNKKTDPETSRDLVDWDREIKNKVIKSDNAEPKTIRFYQLEGFRMYKCHKGIGSRLENTKKIKRFKKIIISPKCRNTIRELKDLTYKVDSNGNLVYDEFNIDPHTFSAIWYGLDEYHVADIKKESRNTKS